MKIHVYLFLAFMLCIFRASQIYAQTASIDTQTIPESQSHRQATTRKHLRVKRFRMVKDSNGKFVIMDKNKKTLYEVFLFDNGPDNASEGLIRVMKNGKIGYANAKTYAIVVEPKFDCAFPFEKGKAKVSNQCKSVKEGEHTIWTSDTWKYIDKKGNFRD